MNDQQQSTSGRRRGRPPQGEDSDTRSRILDTALDLFAAHGFAGTSVRQLARALDLSESALYAHFPSKQAIYDELFRLSGPPVVLATLDTAALLKEDPASAIPAFVAQVVEQWDQPRARLALSMFLRDGSVLQPSASGTATLLGAIAAVQRGLGPIIAAWIAAGQLTDRFTPEQLVWELFGSIAYLRILYFHGHASDAQRAEGQAEIERHVAFWLSCTDPSNRFVPTAPQETK
jgi:AcrR family transcriptional regulator